MASTHIDLKGAGSRLNSEMRTVVDHVLRSQQLVSNLMDELNSRAADTDWASLAADLGDGITTAEAETVYILFNNCNTQLSHANVNEFLSRLG